MTATLHPLRKRLLEIRSPEALPPPPVTMREAALWSLEAGSIVKEEGNLTKALMTYRCSRDGSQANLLAEVFKTDWGPLAKVPRRGSNRKEAERLPRYELPQLVGFLSVKCRDHEGQGIDWPDVFEQWEVARRHGPRTILIP